MELAQGCWKRWKTGCDFRAMAGSVAGENHHLGVRIPRQVKLPVPSNRRAGGRAVSSALASLAWLMNFRCLLVQSATMKPGEPFGAERW